MEIKQLNQWDALQIKQCEKETGQALLIDEQTLVSFSHDFGKLIQSTPEAVCIPENSDFLQSIIRFANQQKLPITIRGNGLSQCGQSLPISGGLTVSMQGFDKTYSVADDAIWVEANASWADLLDVSLKQGKAPYILPYNCNLSVAGVLSVGGVGASSFKFGTITAHVEALEVIDGIGCKQIVTKESPLFHACLSGQGQFAVITKAKIKLRPVKPMVKTCYLVYANHHDWFHDIEVVKDKVDYLELFCSPSMQGAVLKNGKRSSIAQWLYGFHLSVEYDEQVPDVNALLNPLKPMAVLHEQEESISSYLLRHNIRFEMMKMLGQWDLLHPWYECFVPTQVLRENLDQLLNSLPIHYANLVHVAPIEKINTGFLMLPNADSICSLMILNPGVPYPLKDSCLQAINELDSFLIAQGGKRYLSGYLGHDISKNYWEKHFGEQYSSWLELKKQYDPIGIFSSVLYPI